MVHISYAVLQLYQVSVGSVDSSNVDQTRSSVVTSRRSELARKLESSVPPNHRSLGSSLQKRLSGMRIVNVVLWSSALKTPNGLFLVTRAQARTLVK